MSTDGEEKAADSTKQATSDAEPPAKPAAVRTEVAESRSTPTPPAKKVTKKRKPTPTTPRQMLKRTLAAVVVTLLVLEVGVRIMFHVHENGVHERLAQGYPPHTYLRDFAMNADYRFISLYTINPARANNEEYQFDKFGFRMDSNRLAFGEPTKWKLIWMYGGSTAQGLGVRSEETIAATLNKLLARDGSNYRVINMGQGGFTSTQELLLFTEVLQSGFKPDMVVCYDGINEQPFQGDFLTNGAPEWEKHSSKAGIILDVQGAESVHSLLPLTLTRLTKIDDFMTSIQNRLHPPNATAPAADNWEVVVRRHLVSLNMIKAEADHLSVPSFFFFQPVMEYESHYKLRTYSAEEQKNQVPVMNRGEHERHEALLAPAAADLKASLGAEFFDIYDTFRAHDSENLYADPRHPNGVGNAIVAERIYRELKAATSAR